MQDNTISEVTRRGIVDEITLSGLDWAGRLSESDFLARLYDLASLPSTDRRLKDAAGDIQQHRVNWRDWEDDWVFYDSRFNILHTEDHAFLRFLCETVHPIVRSDADEGERLVNQYNNHLRKDGWSLVQAGAISGRPVYAPKRIGERIEVFDDPVGWPKVDRQVQAARQELRTATSEEDFQKVGLLCREVLISVADAVYERARHPPVDAIEPSKTDAARRLDAYFTAELRGGAHEEARAAAKAALKLALALQHKRSADFQMAALCAEATAAVVNLVAVLADRREHRVIRFESA